MIKNERQYRITKRKLAHFSEQLGRLAASDPMSMILDAAHKSQIRTLKSEIAEYEDLVENKVSVVTINSFSDIPLALIKARILKGLNHKTLAEKLMVKEQQIQRWESEEYEGASLNTLKSVASALEVQISSDVLVLKEKEHVAALLRRLAAWGFAKPLLKRILPKTSFDALTGVNSSIESLWKSLNELSSIFGFSIRRLFDPLGSSPLATATSVRYKVSASADAAKVQAFTIYAHYVAALACKAAAPLPSRPIPQDWIDFRREIISKFGKLTLQSTLDYLWSSGIPVIPIRYSGAFHGAVWCIGGRNVIVIKQTTGQKARWLFDLLHEVGHIAKNHVSENFAIVESEPIGQSDDEQDDEEIEANEWAEDVLFSGNSNAIELAVKKHCRNNLQFLREAVKNIATEYEIDVGILANHMAWRLSDEGQNWWGNAENLQKGGEDPFGIVQDALMKYINLDLLSGMEQEMFVEAICKNKED